MANLTPTPGNDSVPQLETNTVALGGAGQIMNAQAQALLNKLEYYVSVLAPRASPTFTGTMTLNGVAVGTPTALTVATNLVEVDLALRNNFTLTLQATTGQTLSNPINAVAGTSGQITITQNATPSTLAYGANWISNDGTTPAVSVTAGAVNVLTYYVVDSTHVWFALNKHGVA